MSCRKATTASTYGQQSASPQCSQKPVGGGVTTPRLPKQKPESAGVWVSPPACRGFYLINRRRTYEPALCKGRCRAERGGGVVPDTNYLLFLFSKLQTFTIPQALPRQLPLLGGASFSLCEHCGNVPCSSQGRPMVARRPDTNLTP